MAAEAMDLAEAVVMIRADMSELKAQFEDMKNVAKHQLGEIGDLISTGIIAVVASKVIGLGKEFIGMAGDVETAVQKFETLLGSAEEAKKIVAEIAEFAAKTPYQMPEIQAAAQQFLIYGMSARQAMDSVKKLGDIAAISGTSIVELSMLYARAKASGPNSVVGQDLLGMLTNRGIMTKKDIVKEMGLQSIMQLDRIMSNGGLRWRHIEPIFDRLTEKGGRFFGGMAKQAATFSGLSSTLFDNVRLIGAGVGQVFLDGAKSFITSAIAITDKIRVWVQAIIELNERTHGIIGRIGALAGIVASVVLLAPKLVWAIRQVTAAMALFEVSTGVGAIIAVVTAAIAAFMMFQEVISAAVSKSGKFAEVGQLWDQMVATMGEAWASFADGFMAMIQPLIDYFNAVVGELSAWISENFELILDVARLVFKTIGTVIAGNIRVVMFVFQAMFQVVSWGLQLITRLAGSTFGGFAAKGGSAIREVLEWLTVLVTNWKIVAKLILAEFVWTFSAMTDGIYGVGKAFVSVFAGIFNIAFSVAMGIGDVFMAAATNIVDTFHMVGDATRVVFRGLTAMAVTFATGVSDALKAAVTGGMDESIAATMEKLKADAAAIRDELKTTVGESEVGKAMKNATADVMKSVNDTINNTAEGLSYQSGNTKALAANMNAMREKLLADKLALEKQRGLKPGQKATDAAGKPAASGGGPDIKPGFVGLEEAAKQMQTSILDRPDKQLGVLQNIEDVNRQMLTEAQKGNAIATKKPDVATAVAG